MAFLRAVCGVSAILFSTTWAARTTSFNTNGNGVDDAPSGSQPDGSSALLSLDKTVHAKRKKKTKKTPAPTPLPVAEPTPAPTAQPSVPSGPAADFTIASMRLAATPQHFADVQQTSKYLRSNGDAFLVVRRCNQFEVIMSAESGPSLLDRSAQDTATAKQQSAALSDKPKPNSPSEAGKSLLAEVAPSKQADDHLKWLKQIKGELSVNTCARGGNQTCKERMKDLKKKHDELHAKCDLPLGPPAESVLAHMFCAHDRPPKDKDDHGRGESDPQTCEEYYADLKKCVEDSVPIETEMAACESCAILASSGGVTSSMAETRRALTREELDRMASTQARKNAVYEEQQRNKRRDNMQLFKAAEMELFRGDGSRIIRASKRANLTLSEWPDDLKFTFGDDAEGWSAARKESCDSRAKECSYIVTIPCDAAVGQGDLMLSSSVKLASRFFVIFNPYHSEDEAHMDTTTFSEKELHTYLMEETAGVWRGSSKSNRAMSWEMGQFDPDVVDAVMKLVTFIPAEQRNQGVRVTRWLTYLINNKVLWGNWCSEDGCMDDASKKPWEWTRSKDIFKEWLQKNELVKYGQCWVFASLLNSACRCLGLGTRVVTNFDSAHGRPPYNKGIDDFFVYDEDSKPTIAHANKKESIWNFHVWNDVWLKRSDLKDFDAADGWQAIDATPQEDSCEVADGEKVCISMMGPAPLNILKSRQMETAGGETPFQAVDAGLSYDSMFVFGETNGDWRGYNPALTDWSKCPEACKADWRGDGYCDKEECNIEACDFDMGDCCEDTCTAKIDGVTVHKSYTCGHGGYDCKSNKSAGWALRYKDTQHVGKSMSTQAPGQNWWDVLIVTDLYKTHQ
jgi:hypothetical protein